MQRHRCRTCKRTFQLSYTASACLPGTSSRIVQLLTEGVSFRCIRMLARNLTPTTNYLPDDTYEVDELCTYVGHKKCLRWVAAAFNHRTRQVVVFTVGRRNSRALKNLLSVIKKLLPSKIYADKISLYTQLIQSKLRSSKNRCNNVIERAFLNLRQSLK